MKIAIIHANHWTDKQAGGELTTKYWLDNAPVEIDWIHNKTINPKLDYDFYLIGDFPEYNNLFYLSRVLKRPHAFLVHNSIKWSYYENYYKNAKFAVTLAPDHAEQIQLPINDIYVTAPWVDWKRFKRVETPNINENEKLYIGLIHSIKIQKTMLQRMKREWDNEFHLYGGGEQFWDFLPNVKIYSEIKNEDLPNVYNQYKTFFWHLDRYGCYGRTLVEALLCEMKLDVSKDKFGLFKYEWIEQGRQAIIDNLERFKERFWADILDKINNYK